MSKITKVLDNGMIPAGVFGEVQLEGNPPGVVQFINNSDVKGSITMSGSLDGVSWDDGKTLTVRARGNKARKFRFTKYLRFQNNTKFPFGPVTILVENAD